MIQAVAILVLGFFLMFAAHDAIKRYDCGSLHIEKACSEIRSNYEEKK